MTTQDFPAKNIPLDAALSSLAITNKVQECVIEPDNSAKTDAPNEQSVDNQETRAGEDDGEDRSTTTKLGKKPRKLGVAKAKNSSKSKKEKDGPDKAMVKEKTKLLGKDPEQAILNVIRQSCAATLSDTSFPSTLQHIKSAFFERNYLSIFTNSSNLPVYTAAYIPARALCYYTLFRNEPLLLNLLSRPTRIFLPGSGSGSELIGIAAAMMHATSSKQKVDLRMMDIGEWEGVLSGLEDVVRKRWGWGEELICGYEKGDVLELGETMLEEIREADLITFMFVMNELFVEKGRAMEMVKRLVEGMKKGAWLLVVDSAGSFSHLKIGGKTYMVYFLLDALKDFEKLVADDSKWYRYPEHLKYPVDIQNMRYFIRLYQKL
ncbi:hypothetical protein BC937DRAFT_88079 [Endogone sp. FLAS-F59071]|nr:hypothetical protein BC937DRAFT_88079 [Endogone sp. FLAS-F59071]|eukprot:RUS19005.1 hypothetical protein BC937DRAFT_88079 [Endogone sp. FLAS-F59071]